MWERLVTTGSLMIGVVEATLGAVGIDLHWALSVLDIMLTEVGGSVAMEVDGWSEPAVSVVAIGSVHGKQRKGLAIFFTPQHL